MRRITFELLPQPAYRHAEIIDLPFLSGPPCDAQQMSVREHAPWMPRKLGEHRIFLGGQMDFLPVTEDCSPEEINRHAVDFERPLIRFRAELQKVGDMALELGVRS